MTQEELFVSIKDAIKDVVNNQKLNVEKSSTLIGDLGLESIDFLDLSSEIENTIGFEIDFKEVVEHVKQSAAGVSDIKGLTVQNIIDFIEVKKA